MVPAGAAEALGLPPVLMEAQGLTKRFGDFTALDDVSLTIRAGERHALVGENGAGKSTLVKILYGLLAPDAGTMRWEGKTLRIANPAAARRLGIGMVFQHFSVFDALTVAENVALALPGERLGGLPARIEAVAETYGLPLDPHRRVHTLSAGAKQRVEIVRALLQKPRLLIMDEPTSVLTPQEAETLFAALRRLSEGGVAVLYISHKLQEVADLCEAGTVLRRGRVVGQPDPRIAEPAEIAAMMVGERVRSVEKPETPALSTKVRLQVLGLNMPAPGDGTGGGAGGGAGGDAGRSGCALQNINLTVRDYEVVGIAGIAGEGQDELMAALTGERLCDYKGTIELNGRRLAHKGPVERRDVGCGFVVEDRLGHGAVPGMSLWENVILTRHGEKEFGESGFVKRGAARDRVARIREAFDVRASSEAPIAGSLSGGNLQKFVVGREIERRPRLLVVNQPTWGVDAAAARMIRQSILDLAAGGAGVLVISQDLDELFELCDKIGVIYRGKLTSPRPVDRLDAATLGLLMAGKKPQTTLIRDEEGAA
ncbi:MAG: ABC transporter ATP-binding protein [Pseudomonadota bacterium]